MVRSPAREVALVYAAVCGAIFAVTRLRGVPPVGEYVHLAVGALFLLSAYRLAQREVGGLVRHGIDLAGLMNPPDEIERSTPHPDARPGGFFGLGDLARALIEAAPAAARETGFALVVALVVFPPFALGFAWWHGAHGGLAFDPPADLGSFVLAQLIVAALPEEAFFRGYVQTRLSDQWPSTRRLLGADVSAGALVAQAALFALVHFAVDAHPARLAVFFPGLLFGWLRARRGGIGAAIVFHAACNVYSELLVRGWLG